MRARHERADGRWGVTMSSITTNGSALSDLFALARALKQAGGLLPPHLRNEGEILAVILAGRELGLGPMVSLRSIHLIKGKVVLAADTQLALMRAAGVKVRWLKDGTDGEAQLELRREGDAPHVSRFTLQMAQQAGLMGNDTWRKHPAAMLRARCVSAAGKAYMPDALAGCYVPGELDDVEPSPVLSVVPSLPVPAPDNRQQDAQAPAEGPKALPKALPADAGVPQDAPRAARGQEWAAIREMHQGKLRACQTQEELRAWIRAVGEMRYPEELRLALWGNFVAQCKAMKVDAQQFTKAGR